MEKVKVFCKECDWLDVAEDEFPIQVDDCDCFHESNIKARYGWFSRECLEDNSTYPERKPGEINRNNDCPWFKLEEES